MGEDNSGGPVDLCGDTFLSSHSPSYSTIRSLCPYSPSPSPPPPTTTSTIRSGSPSPVRGYGRIRSRSPLPASTASPTRGRGRHRHSLSPLRFPNCRYSFSDPPPFTGDPQGPTFSLRNPGSATAYTYFSLFFDDPLLEHIANQTNLYARLHPLRRANYQWRDTNVDELRLFLGIFIATGLVSLPNLADYWETNSIFSQPGIVKGMSRNRFEQLCGRLNFNDSSLAPAYGTPGYDKLYKIRPVIDAICSKSKTLYNPGENISVDEAMVKFKGRSSIKQYQPLKPTKRGFKVWCRADSTNGYIDNFVVYTGKSGDGPTTNLGHKVVMEICKDILGKGYHVYCDNYFTSIRLAADLLEHGTHLVGTTRPDRIDFPREAINKDAVAGDSRGIAVSTTLDDKIHCFVWLDSKPVFFVDTLFGCSLHTTVPRGMSDGTRTQIACPEAVKAYNENMGGVDLADQMRRFYTCTHRSSRRWYLRLFWFLVDLAIDNALILESFRPDQRRRKNKDFRKELATELLSKYISRQRAGRQAQNAPARLLQRHFPDNLGTDSQCVVCSKEHTRKRTRYGCKDCGNVHLCISPCFRIYHTRL